MYTSVEFNSQITVQMRVPCPISKKVSYTNLVFGLDVTLNLDYTHTQFLIFNVSHNNQNIYQIALKG